MGLVQNVKEKVALRRRHQNNKRRLKKQPKRKQPRGKAKAESYARPWRLRKVDRKEQKPLSATSQTRVAQRVQSTRLQPLRARTLMLRDMMRSARWVSGLVLAMCVVTLYRTGTDARFLLDNISVTGAQFLPADTIVGASGLRDNHIFSVEPEVALEKIENLPGVTDVSVSIQWPDMASIHVEEDQPLLIWEEAGNSYWVNSSGEIVPIVAEKFDLLRVIANVPPAPAPTPIPTPEPVEEGEEPAVVEDNGVVDRPNTYLSFVPDEVLLGALSLQQEISRTQGVQIDTLVYEIHGGLSYFDAGGWKAWAGVNGDIPLDVPGGWRVFLGAEKDMATKVAMYNAVVASLTDREIVPEYVNVSNIDRPFYKPVFSPEPVEVPSEG